MRSGWSAPGPPGLAAAAFLARAGHRVQVLPLRARVHAHRWGAPWGVFEDSGATFAGRLDQYDE